MAKHEDFSKQPNVPVLSQSNFPNDLKDCKKYVSNCDKQPFQNRHFSCITVSKSTQPTENNVANDKQLRTLNWVPMYTVI